MTVGFLSVTDILATTWSGSVRQITASLFNCLKISPGGCPALRGMGKAARTLASERPYPAKEMTTYGVSRAVNSPKNNKPELIEPVT